MCTKAPRWTPYHLRYSRIQYIELSNWNWVHYVRLWIVQWYIMHSIPPPFAIIQSFLDSCATIPFTTKQAFPSNLFIHSLYNYSFIPFVTIQSLSSQLCNHSLYNDSNIPFTTIQIFPSQRFKLSCDKYSNISITTIQTYPLQLCSRIP